MSTNRIAQRAGAQLLEKAAPDTADDRLAVHHSSPAKFRLISRGHRRL